MGTIKPKDNNFSFTMNIAKSFTMVEDDGEEKLIIRGIASGTERDRQGDSFSREGLLSIKKAIEEGLVDDDGEWSQIPLRSGHRTEWDDILGWVTKADIDEDNRLWIEAELDKDSSKALDLHRKLTRGNGNGRKVKLGLSVRGTVTEYHFGFDPEVKKSFPRFDKMSLREISVTQKPVYPTPVYLAIAKSLTADPEYQQGMEESMSQAEDQNVQVEKAEEDSFTPRAFTEEGMEETSKAVEAARTEGANEKDSTVNEAAEEVNQHNEDASESPRYEEPNLPQEVEDRVETDSDVREDGANNNENNSEVENKIPEGYVAIGGNVASEAKPEENQEVTTDPEKTSELDDIRSSIDQISELLSGLKSEVDNIQSSREVQKAQPEETPEATPEETSDDMNSRIAIAVASAFKELGLDKLSGEVEAVKSAVDEMSHQPVDKSISVRKAKDEEDENDPTVRYRRMIEDGVDPIRAGLMASGRSK